MSWNTNATTAATAVLTDNGSIFGDLAEIQAERLKDIELGKVFQLGRFEILKTTKKQGEPFVIVEADGVIYSGYARAISNQLIQMAQAASADPVNEAYDNQRKAWTEIAVGLPVFFAKQTSDAGEYLIMQIGANADGESLAPAVTAETAKTPTAAKAKAARLAAKAAEGKK